MPLIMKRSKFLQLRASVKHAITFDSKHVTYPYENKRGRCYICERADYIKTKFKGDICRKFICNAHRQIVKQIKCDTCNVDITS